MDLKDLFSDSYRKTADLAVAYIGSDPVRFKLVLEFALEDDGQYAMRAARAINLSSFRHPQLIRPFLPLLVNKLGSFQNDGLKRGMLKTLFQRSYEYSDDVFGRLVDICFQFVNDPGEKVAIKIYALELLYRSSISYPEIKPEIISTIENIMPMASRGIQSRGKKMLKILYREIG